MARRKTGEKKGTDQKDRAASREENIHNVQADDHSIAFEEFHVGGDVRGDIRIGHTIGYTAEQVSVLLKQITTRLQPKPFDGRCPYKGLEVFEEEDAELFFGRERLVEDLLSRVKESRTVFITGPSGSGKSSLVRAGLIHALKNGAINALHSDRWLYETMKPGRDPIKDLALAFSRLKSPELEDYFLAHSTEPDILNKCAESVLSGRKDQRLVLFVDQFEEVFTQINSEEERVSFINMLAHAGTMENGRVIVLFAMRSDFLSNCQTYPNLNTLLSRNYGFASIGGMQREELLRAIALPAMHVGLPVENELIAQIINDMKSEPDALPLMQFALKDLFDAQQAKGGVIALTLKDYLQHGGIHKSLERHADATFAKLNQNEQELTRSIFSGLIEIGRGTQDTKRTALFDELIPANTKAEDILAIVQKLADARLIITDEQAGKDTVTISHEKLIEAWPWLKKLVNENRDVIALQNEIASDAKEWEDHERDSSYLYTGARLANAREQLQAKKIVLSGPSYEFVQAGSKQRARRQMANRFSVAIIGIAMTVAIVVFRVQSNEYQKIASTAQAANTESVSQKATAQAASTLAVAQATEAQKQAQISRANELAAQSNELREKNFRLSLLLGIEAFRIRDTTRSRGVLLDNINTNPQLRQILARHMGSVNCVAFSPDGKILASSSDDGKIILWDVATYQPIGKPLTGYYWPAQSFVFSPDGKLLASGSADGMIILWDVATQLPIDEQTWHTASPSLSFSPDGKILASGSVDGVVILWDVAFHRLVGQPLTEDIAGITSVAFSPDGKILALGGLDKTITLWDIASRQPIGKPLTGHTGTVYNVAFSPDGKTLASGSSDGTIILWDVASHQPIGTLLSGLSNSVSSFAFSPDGKILASGSDTFLDRFDNTIILWDIASQKPIGQPLTKHASSVNSIAFSPDGRVLATASKDSTIMLWNVTFHQYIGWPFTGHTDSVSSVAFSPDGKTLASGSRDKTITLWDIASRQPIGQPLTWHRGIVNSVAFSPDGKTLASGSRDKTITLWDLASHQVIEQLLAGRPSSVSSVAFSPDGKTLATGSEDDTVILWDLAAHQPIGQPLTGHISLVNSVAFSPDGKTLASGSFDSTIILWDVASHQPIGQPLTGHTASVNSVVFSPDGKMLASGSEDKTIILWDINPETWVQKSCQRAGSNFTRAEWERYFPNEEYHQTCEQWPLEPEATPTASPTP